MTDEQAGILIKNIYYFQKTGELLPMDFGIKMAITPFINQFKRDNESWKIELKNKSASGKLGNLKRWNNDLYTQVIENHITIERAEEIAESRKNRTCDNSDKENRDASQKSLVSVNVNDNVNVNVNYKESNDSRQNEILPNEEKVDKFEELKKMSLDQIYEQYKTKPTDVLLNVCMWNHFAEKHKKPKISKITNGRKKKLNLRLKNKDFIISKILSEVKNQKFAMDGDWFTFDWIIDNDENYVKVLEGKYVTAEKEEIKSGNFTI